MAQIAMKAKRTKKHITMAAPAATTTTSTILVTTKPSTSQNHFATMCEERRNRVLHIGFCYDYVYKNFAVITAAVVAAWLLLVRYLCAASICLLSHLSFAMCLSNRWIEEEREEWKQFHLANNFKSKAQTTICE